MTRSGMKSVLYRCGSCGHEEMLDPADWTEHLPACPVELYDPVNDEMTGDAACPESVMRPRYDPPYEDRDADDWAENSGHGAMVNYRERP